MWFKALRIYQLTRPQTWQSQSFEEGLAKQAFQPCMAQQEQSLGWISPTGQAQLIHQQGDQWLIALKVEEKILPKSVINEQVQLLAEQRAASEQRTIGRKEKQQLAEEVKITLLPQAFTRSRQLHLWIDLQQQRLIFNHSSEKLCELALNLLRESLGSLPVIPLNTQLTSTQVMTQWLIDQPAQDFTLLDQCELRDPEDSQAVVRCKGQDLQSEEIRQLVAHGQQVTQLRLDWQDQVQFTLTDQLGFKTLQYADQLIEEAADVNPDQDPLIALDAEFILMTNCLSGLIDRLIQLHEGLHSALHTPPEL